MNPDPLTERLARLEASVAHLERLGDQLNQVITEQGRQMDRLQKRLELISRSLDTHELERLRNVTEKPPHYAP